MPEVLLELHWPDGEASRFYSPSTVVYEFLKPGETLSIAELEQKGLAALREASERVRARDGLGDLHQWSCCWRERRVRLQRKAATTPIRGNGPGTFVVGGVELR